VEQTFHPIAAKEASEIENAYARISEDLANRFWTELNEAIDEVFFHPEQQHCEF
jgi:hypothetical protein